jgi:lipopolysaccharide/colanic/teichoic acid biosynthesis glycosyltransferase
LVQYLPLYNETQRRRHEVRPELLVGAGKRKKYHKLKAKFEYDVWYVENISFGVDLKNIMAYRS